MVKPSLDDICKCGHLRGEHFRRVCTMAVDEGENACECNRFRLDEGIANAVPQKGPTE